MPEFHNHITYNQLLTFKAIFEAGNISKAAKKLGISTASVSYSLKSLEKSLQQTLFLRTTRAINPTDVGTQLYERIHFSMDDLSAAVSRVCDLNNTPSGTLSLNMTRSIYQFMLKDMLRDFQHAFPSIQLEITLSETLDHYVKDAIDVGFRFGETVDEGLIAKPISPWFTPMKMALFTSATYAKNHGIPSTIAELSGHTFIKFRLPTSKQLAPLRLHKTPDPLSEMISIDVPTGMVVNDADALVDMVSSGFGMGAMGDAMLEEGFTSGTLLPVLKDHWCDIPTVYMYYTRESKRSLKVRSFVSFINQRLSQKQLRG